MPSTARRLVRAGQGFAARSTASPERLWLAEAGEDLRGSFCAPTVLLCSEEHGAAWALAQGGRGRLLALDEASRVGATEWAACADAARRLA